MANSTVHTVLSKVEKSGSTTNITTIYPKNTAEDVIVSPSGNVPSTATNMKALLAALGSLAFKSSVTGLGVSNFTSGVVTESLTITDNNHIASAKALKTLNDKITTNANNITKLNSKCENATLTVAGWTGSTAPYKQAIALSSSNLTSISKIEVIVSPEATNAQNIAWMNAIFCGGTLSDSTLTLQIYGKKPEVAIPIVVIVRGEI